MSSRVDFDAHGIPHVWGDSVTELAFAQGGATALQRPGQLTLERLRGEGRVAERHGAAGIAWDVFARRARLAETARRAHAGLEEETRAWVDSYVAGVNAELDAADHWQPWTPLAVFLVQHILFGTFPDKLWRARVRAALGDTGAEVLRGGPPLASGSNAFALTGDRTASGLPLVAGDPHRMFEAPNVYAQVHLACPEFEVAGLAFPGVPGVQHFGHTGHVAWAVTNAMADYQDLYTEELVRHDGRVWARGPDGWEATESHTERVHVLDGSRIDVEVVTTARGPVVLGGADDAASEAVSLRTPSWVLGDLGFGALLPLLRARSVEDVETALDAWVEPVNNWVVADRAGTVRHRVAGRVPLRHPKNREVPVPAATGDHGWTDWADLPRMAPDACGRLVTANDRGDADYDVLGSHFAPSWRADRIRELLAAGHAWTPETVAEVLLDERQLGADDLMSALGTLTGLTPRAEALRVRLLAWDRSMAAGSTSAALYDALRDALVSRLHAAPPLAGLTDATAHGDLFAPWLSLPGRLATALPSLLVHGQRLGLDPVGELAGALEDVADVETAGVWGTRHRFAPLTGLQQLGLPDQDPPDVAGRPLGGDGDCVAVQHAAPFTGRVWRGPVARYVWDLAGHAPSRWAVPLGATEQGPHRTDQFEAWRSGELLPLLTHEETR